MNGLSNEEAETYGSYCFVIKCYCIHSYAINELFKISCSKVNQASSVVMVCEKLCAIPSMWHSHSRMYIDCRRWGNSLKKTNVRLTNTHKNSKRFIVFDSIVFLVNREKNLAHKESIYSKRIEKHILCRWRKR